MTDTLRTRGRLACGVSMVALVLAASSAFAQSASPPPAASPTAVEQVIVTATGRQAHIQDVPIAITAVTADTVKNAGISDLKAVQDVVPTYHLTVGQSAAAGSYAAIRGINTGGDNAGFESAVGFFIDGVYRNRAGVALSQLPEVDRIEVLEGPQGTLFGRNTTAGAISVTTKAPEFKERGFLDLTVGNLADREVVFGLTGPLLPDEVLAGKIDGSYQKRDGYITDVVSGRKFNDRDRWNLRGQLLWNINNDAKLRLIADVANTNEQCCYAVTADLGATAPAIDFLSSLVGEKGLLPPDPSALQATATPRRDDLERVKEWGLSGQLDWNLNGVKLTSITAYRDWKLTRDQDVDFSSLDRAYRQGYIDEFKTFTEEVRFQGVHGPLNWLAGGSYADETLDHTDNIKLGAQAAQYVDALASGASLGPLGAGYNIYGSLGSTGCATVALFPTCRLLAAGLYAGGVPAATANAFADAVAATAPSAGQGQNNDFFQTHTRTFSIFTHNEISLTDNLTWTIGARFNHEDKDLTATLPPATGTACPVFEGAFNGLATALFNSALQPFLLLTCNPVINTVANGSYATGSTENELTGTTSLKYKPTRDVMVYASYSRGYKAGGYNLDRSGFNITPVSTTQPSASDLHFSPEFVNAYEVGVKSTLFGGMTTLDANAFYEDISDYQNLAFSGFNFLTRNVAKVVSRGVEVNAIVRPTDGLTLQTGVLFNEAFFDSTTNYNPVGFNFASNIVPAGTMLPSSSKWTITAAMTYKRMIPGTNLQGLLFLDARYSSGYTTETLGRDPTGSTDQGAFTVVNGRIGVGPQGGHWSAELFVRNMFDQYYNVYAFAVPEQTGTYDIYPAEPRTFGATLKLTF